MDWNEVRGQARRWARAKRTELLTGNQPTREQAAREVDSARSKIGDAISTEATFTAAERLLPANLAASVRAHRPEQVAARNEQAYRDELAQRSLARLDLTIQTSDGQIHSGRSEFPSEVTAPEPDEAAAMLTVSLEAADPVPFGTTSLQGLTLDIPQFRGVGRYDLADLYRQGEQGVIPSWDSSGICLRVGDDHGEDYLYWQPDAGSGEVTVSADALRFDLPVAGASATGRATGSIAFPEGLPGGE